MNASNRKDRNYFAILELRVICAKNFVKVFGVTRIMTVGFPSMDTHFPVFPVQPNIGVWLRF